MSKKIIAIVGTYRKGKTIDTAVDELLEAARQQGAQTEKIFLLDKHIEFCTNCRCCMQQPGEKRGDCVLDDDTKRILDGIDAADGIVLAAPVNWFNVTAVMRVFIERLVPYGYWPWGAHAPKNRIKKPTKKAVIMTSAAPPEFIARLLYPGAMSVLKSAAKCVGAKVESKIFIGMAAQTQDQTVPEKYKRQLADAGKLLAS